MAGGKGETEMEREASSLQLTHAQSPYLFKENPWMWKTSLICWFVIKCQPVPITTTQSR